MVSGGGARPPYGPAQGMLQGLDLLRRLNPSRVDEELLRGHSVAPGNEYKVVGALRFLGLLDDDGRPTEESRLLKTRGSTYTLALQGVIRAAYAPLFAELELKAASREDVYNHFVRRWGLGVEMANKATRFFIELCRVAEIEVGASRERRRAPLARPPEGRGARRAPSPHPTAPAIVEPTTIPWEGPLVLAVTPETARLSEAELTELLRRLRSAWRRSAEG